MKAWMKILVCSVLSFSFLFMTTGYAVLTDNLSISGVANVDAYVRFTVTYMIGDEVYLVDYHVDPTTNYTVKGAPSGYEDFERWVNANGDVVTTIPGYNTNDYVLYATWLSKYTINFIDANGNLIYSEEFTEGANKISGEGQAIVDKWLADERAEESANQINVDWSSYDLSNAQGNLIVRPLYKYSGYLNMKPIYEEPDDGVADYYQVEAVDSLPANVTVPGYVGEIPVKVIFRITNVDGESDWNNYENTVKKITIEEGIEVLEWNSLAWTPNLTEVNLPNSLQVMKKNVFSRNDLFGNDKKKLTINFNGTMEEWRTVLRNSDGDWDGGLKSGTIVQCTDGYFALSGSWSLSWKEYPGKTTLEYMPDVIESSEIELIWDRIDDTYMVWYPMDEQQPVPGDSYEIAFEPEEGYIMAENIGVIINDTEYVVPTKGYVSEGDVVPVYDSENNVLMIPSELLTAETKTITIIAFAVADEFELITKQETTVEPESTTEPEIIVEFEPTKESETIVESEPTMEPETIVESEPTMEPETVVESEPTMELETTVDSEPTTESSVEIE